MKCVLILYVAVLNAVIKQKELIIKTIIRFLSSKPRGISNIVGLVKVKTHSQRFKSPLAGGGLTVSLAILDVTFYVIFHSNHT